MKIDVSKVPPELLSEWAAAGSNLAVIKPERYAGAIALLKEYGRYIPETGRFQWVRPRSGYVGRPLVLGQDLGRLNPHTGRCEVSIAGYHRLPNYILVYLYHNGPPLPGYQIDHIDNDKTNDRIENLQQIPALLNSVKGRVGGLKGAGLRAAAWLISERLSSLDG